MAQPANHAPSKLIGRPNWRATELVGESTSNTTPRYAINGISKENYLQPQLKVHGRRVRFVLFIQTRHHPLWKEREDSKKEAAVDAFARHLGQLALESPGLPGLAVFIQGWGAHRLSGASSRTCRRRQASRPRSGNDDGLQSRAGIEVRRHWKIAGLTAQKRPVQDELGTGLSHSLNLLVHTGHVRPLRRRSRPRPRPPPRRWA